MLCSLMVVSTLTRGEVLVDGALPVAVAIVAGG